MKGGAAYRRLEDHGSQSTLTQTHPRIGDLLFSYRLLVGTFTAVPINLDPPPL